MRLRNLLSKIFRIEFLLVLTATLSFLVTLFFKNLELRNFRNLVLKLDQCITFYKQNDLKLYESLNELDNAFTQFTYFNEALDNDAEYFIKTAANIDSPESVVNSAYFSLQKQMYVNQQQLNFGYECLIFICFFIELAAILVFFQKNSMQKNELKITKAINENRLNFSREIHDGVAQDLAALKMCLENNNSKKAQVFAEQAFNEVRFLIETTHMNLTKDFEQILKETISAFEINFSIKSEVLIASANLKFIQDSIKLELLRILNEALSNVARHSKASSVTLKITDFSNGIRFIISDNGIGIQDSPDSEKRKKHFGIENIKARVNDMHGTVDFILDGGTTIAITIKNPVS